MRASCVLSTRPAQARRAPVAETACGFAGWAGVLACRRNTHQKQQRGLWSEASEMKDGEVEKDEKPTQVAWDLIRRRRLTTIG